MSDQPMSHFAKVTASGSTGVVARRASSQSITCSTRSSQNRLRGTKPGASTPASNSAVRIAATSGMGRRRPARGRSIANGWPMSGDKGAVRGGQRHQAGNDHVDLEWSGHHPVAHAVSGAMGTRSRARKSSCRRLSGVQARRTTSSSRRRDCWGRGLPLMRSALGAGPAGRYMRSGAAMPSRSSPVASTRAVRSHKTSRLRNVGSGARSTGQFS